MKNLWPLFGLFFSLFGCASINKSPSVIRINADGSAVKVQLVDDENQRTQVITPALTTIAPGSSFQTSLESHLQKTTHSCSLEWGKSILPNSIPIVFGPVGITLALVFTATDYFTGNIYDCDQLINVAGWKKENKKKQKKIIRAFIIPPRIDDSKVSDFVAQKFSEVLNSEKIKLVPLTSSKGELANLGINNANSPKLKDLPFARLRKFALIGKVEYAIHLEVTEEALQIQNRYRVTPILINLVTEKKEKLKSFKVKASSSQSSFWSSVAGVINFIPNSLTLSYYNKPRIDDQSNGNIFLLC